MTCTKDQAILMIKEFRDIMTKLSTERCSYLERKKHAERLQEIKTELQKFRRDNPDA